MIFSKADRCHLEAVVHELIQLYNVQNPPVPVETMLEQPYNQMWENALAFDLSSKYYDPSEPYNSRMGLARMLTRNLRRSQWGRDRRLDHIVTERDQVHAFARMLVLPRALLKEVHQDDMNPLTLSEMFQVPIGDIYLDESSCD